MRQSVQWVAVATCLISLAGCAVPVVKFEVEDEAIVGIGEQDEPSLVDDRWEALDPAPRVCGTFRSQQIRCTRMTARLAGVDLSKQVASPPYAVPLPAMNRQLGVLYETRSKDDQSLLAANKIGISRVNELDEAEFGWTTLEKTIDGADVAQIWRSLARSGRTYACTQSICSRMIFATATNRDDVEEGIAVCDVVKTPSGNGPPYNCRFVLLQLPETTMIRAAVSYYIHMYALAGRPDFYMRVGIASTPDEDALVQIVSKALAAAPLALLVERDGYDVLGVSNYRYSRLLGQWAYETVRVNLKGVASGPVRGSLEPVLTVTSTLYLSNQNSSDPTDWHLPRMADQSRYVETLSTALRQALQAVCPRGQWEQDGSWHRLRCDQ